VNETKLIVKKEQWQTPKFVQMIMTTETLGLMTGHPQDATIAMTS
jgi:hypothetical protein